MFHSMLKTVSVSHVPVKGTPLSISSAEQGLPSGEWRRSALQGWGDGLESPLEGACVSVSRVSPPLP